MPGLADHLTAAELDRIADKVDGSHKLTGAERTTVVDALRRFAEAQRQWDAIHKRASSHDRVARLLGVLARLLNRWDV